MTNEYNGLRYPTHKLPDVLDDGEPFRMQGLWNQCRLRGSQGREHTCWLPSVYAVTGMEVIVMESEWVVIDVFRECLNPGTEQQALLSMHRARAAFRKAT